MSVEKIMKQARPSDRIPHANERQTDTPLQEAHLSTEPENTGEEEMQWSRGSDLAAPPPRPGYVQCWIRSMLGGEADVSNIARSMSPGEGWKPRLASTVPKGHTAPTLQHGAYGDVIGVAGMILCERPVKMQQQRDAYYAEQLRKQHESIDRDIYKVQRPGHPISQQRTTTTGRAPRPAAFLDDQS
jgi:hypothetical protein